MHRNTVRKRLKDMGLYATVRFSDVSDATLGKMIRLYKRTRPRTGLRFITGYLKANGLKVQKERVRLLVREIDGLGQLLRNHRTVDRREYRVPRPHSLWHMDGHHKLIRWGIVIHGMIDGFSRTVSRVITLLNLTFNEK